MSRFYENAHKIFFPVFRFLYRIRIDGEENEPATPGFLVCANHLSFRDVLVIGASLKNPVCFLAKKELFSIPLLSQLIRALGAVPIDRKASTDVGALKKATSLLKNGESVAIFPQGTRKAGVDPRETETKNGPGFLVRRTGCDVLPVSIQTKNYKVRPFKKTYVTIGKPIPPPPVEENVPPNESYASISRTVFDAILRQLKEDADL